MRKEFRLESFLVNDSKDRRARTTNTIIHTNTIFFGITFKQNISQNKMDLKMSS